MDTAAHDARIARETTAQGLDPAVAALLRIAARQPDARIAIDTSDTPSGNRLTLREQT